MADSKYLVIASCVHFGARGHARSTFREYVRWIKKHRAGVYLIGDTMDCGICWGTKHIGSVWENDANPEEQIDIAEKELWPIRRQIRAMSTGNHEERIQKVCSLNPVKILAKRLGATYTDTDILIRWHGKKIFAAHGAGGDGDFTKIQQGWQGLDAIVLGHTHQLKATRMRRRTPSGRMADFDMVRAGSFLDNERYARLALHSPTQLGSPIFEWVGNRYKIHLGL